MANDSVSKRKEGPTKGRISASPKPGPHLKVMTMDDLYRKLHERNTGIESIQEIFPRALDDLIRSQENVIRSDGQITSSRAIQRRLIELVEELRKTEEMLAHAADVFHDERLRPRRRA